ncbi:hypothetical protein [Nostoc sp. 'Lobaria pulmonaria (5183) cyanobiont']|uniref:hypothetical protein n=1 Tax=Nostoc sp. 'Lobaria pulmonaria (5183) cyanobiont' TaxID=1618022 RepID=UPI000CF34920|nr:hypothetical protein [Nostoc sp. 'Lobaria pulmonaria (5183) cyanobiont']AVH69273.1 hypothetical protein NLP_0366 [Nostoc sp. 'Lobaria pulmonaria (5183) cyanobiont']
MLKPNRISIVLAAAALIVIPTLLTAPASAQTKVYVVGDRDQNWDRDGRSNSREVRNSRDRDNWNRDGRSNSREVRNSRDRDNWNRDGRSNSREVRNPRDRDNWNRDNQFNGRVVRLGNGDIRYPNGQIIPARSVVRLRDQGYFRLPNGDILLPNQEIVPAGRLVRVRDDYFRLPSGLVLQINL